MPQIFASPQEDISQAFLTSYLRTVSWVCTLCKPPYNVPNKSHGILGRHLLELRPGMRIYSHGWPWMAMYMYIHGNSCFHISLGVF